MSERERFEAWWRRQDNLGQMTKKWAWEGWKGKAETVFPTPSPERKTVSVRIAVGVNDRGEWSSFGYGGKEIAKSDAEWAGQVLECMEEAINEAVHFVTATLPVPVSEEIQGQVEEEKP